MPKTSSCPKRSKMGVRPADPVEWAVYGDVLEQWAEWVVTLLSAQIARLVYLYLAAAHLLPVNLPSARS